MIASIMSNVLFLRGLVSKEIGRRSSRLEIVWIVPTMTGTQFPHYVIFICFAEAATVFIVQTLEMKVKIIA